MLIETEFKEKLSALKRLKDDRARACRQLEEQVELLNMEIQEKGKPFDDQIAGIKQQLIARALEYGNSFRCNDGAISFRKGYKRVTYAAKALDAICQRHPLVKDLIWHNRTETEVAPAVTVEVF